MRITDNGEEIIIHLEGRIDSGNAHSIENEIAEVIGGRENIRVKIDARELDYISSAGLRVLLKIRKQLGYSLEIRNVSKDVYDIFDTTGFTSLFDVKKSYRSINVDGLEVIGRGFFGTVYRLDDETIVKVYQGEDSIQKIENEKRMAKKAFLSGIPTAISYDIVKAGEDYGSVFELLNAKSFHELAQNGDMPLADIIVRYTELLKQVHETRVEFGELPSYRDRFLDYVNVIKGCLKDGQEQQLKKLLADMPEENIVVHGDIHMKNVMMVDNEPMLIDMDTLGLGNPVFDLAGLYVTYQMFEEDDPDNSMDFLGMSNEMVDEIWNRIMDSYFDFRDSEEKKKITDRIVLVAVIRFLFLIVTTDLKNSELGKKRIDHAVSHIEELLKTVTQLSI
ncbi:MAG: anti-sigma factor antagonist [Lachnospiraceae bacterium]|nr:anti-sigma factor antagonist [Lachnospiraceae bacterium]